MGAVALSDLTFQIPTNGVFCVFGASESGKTTLLNTICGLTEIKQGCIYINNVRVDKNTPANHNICLALETGAFFENKSVNRLILLSFNPCPQIFCIIHFEQQVQNSIKTQTHTHNNNNLNYTTTKHRR